MLVHVLVVLVPFLSAACLAPSLRPRARPWLLTCVLLKSPAQGSQKLPDGDYDIWQNGADTGKDLNSSSDGNNVETDGPPAWFGQWVESQNHYDQHPGDEKLEIYPTASSDIFEFKLKDGDGDIIMTGTLSKAQ